MFALEKNRVSSLFIVAFAVVSVIEITAEFFGCKTLLWIFKPMLVPLLMMYYFSETKKTNNIFITSLGFLWIANIFFIERNLNFITIGSVFFLIYKALIILLIFKIVKLPSKIPLILGSIPFLFIYTTLCCLTYDVLGSGFFLFISHGIFVIFTGGYSLGSYIMNPNRANLYLLFYSMLLTITQFIFVLKLYLPQHYDTFYTR